MHDNLSPAEVAANEAINKIHKCLENKKSFILEAGAGAGKTHSLIMALRHIIITKGSILLRNNQKVACITYTNVAKDEIRDRTDSHPAILSATIHSFCWSLIKDFQIKLRSEIPGLSKWSERIEQQGEIGNKEVKYDLGYPKINDREIWLGHNDIIALTVKLLDEPKFRIILINKFPIIFIDEYQDTDKDFAASLKKYFLDQNKGLLLGFFGDHWQKIYGSNSSGKIMHENLTVIEKKANFRSDKLIVECLNKIRPELPQNVRDNESNGLITVYHTNLWQGDRRKGGHWDGDLPAEAAHRYLEKVKNLLSNEGWDLSPSKTKFLMLTHNVLAEEQGYKNLADVFERTESYIRKEDDYIAFFNDVLEPICSSYLEGKYGEMFTALSGKKIKIRQHIDKQKWLNMLGQLIIIRSTGTIGSVISHLQNSKLPRLSEKIERQEEKFLEVSAREEKSRTEEESKFINFISKLKSIKYEEVISLSKYIQDKTPFATKHGVKGAEFENVVIVFGRGWNQYNFVQMLEWFHNGVPNGKVDSFERNRNLFYVACSRPKKRLAILFTQKLSDDALSTVERFFDQHNIVALSLN